MISIGINAAAKKERMKGLVNAERDRRIQDNFVFNTVAFDFDTNSKSNIAGAASLAGFAIGAGALVGNYQWNGSGVDFSWLAEDNTSVLMDAQTTFAFGAAAAEHTRAHIVAARALKDLAVIPEDYTNDSHWPAYS